MTDFLHTDARWTEHFVEVSDPHKEGHHVRFYFEPPHKEQIAKLTEMLEIQQKLHETAIDMLKPAIEAEREACAKLLETTDLSGLKDNPAIQSWVAEMLLAYVKAIRARGQA